MQSRGEVWGCGRAGVCVDLGEGAGAASGVSEEHCGVWRVSGLCRSKPGVRKSWLGHAAMESCPAFGIHRLFSGRIFCLNFLSDQKTFLCLQMSPEQLFELSFQEQPTCIFFWVVLAIQDPEIAERSINKFLLAAFFSYLSTTQMFPFPQMYLPDVDPAKRNEFGFPCLLCLYLQIKDV